jgi:hypothetical protein
MAKAGQNKRKRDEDDHEDAAKVAKNASPAKSIA